MTVEASSLNLETELAQNVKTLLKVSSADLEAVMKRYDVTNEMLIEMVKNVRDWYIKQPHLPKGQIHDRQILGHLMLRKFSVENAKMNIENFYTARRKMPELLCGRDPRDEKWLQYLERGFWLVLPQKTADNCRILIFRMNEEGGVSSLILKVAFLILEYRIWNDASLGDCWIMDFKHSTFQQAMQLTPVMVSKIIYYLTSCFGTTLRSVHLLNMPPFAASILKLFMKGTNTKLVSRIHVSKVEDLLNIFSKEILPIEYGGTELNCQQIADECFKTFQSEPWRKYLVEQDTILTDESKRLTPSKADEIFGVDGSFRKLRLD